MSGRTVKCAAMALFLYTEYLYFSNIFIIHSLDPWNSFENEWRKIWLLSASNVCDVIGYCGFHPLKHLRIDPGGYFQLFFSSSLD